ncbi:hypothetical protein GCM10009821_27640 [Aeromicrobium halocynthiae]|uniref:Uncharacterized protein n=1 Tax=Aeromicrobium halocynthiae TaxID=560557 RepID=A0ABP5HVF0_9ACTN
MRLLVLAVVGVALGVVVRVVLGRRPNGDETVAPLRVVPPAGAPRPPPTGASPVVDTTAETATRPSPLTVVEEPRRPAPGLDASAGWEELTATSIGSRPDR